VLSRHYLQAVVNAGMKLFLNALSCAFFLALTLTLEVIYPLISNTKILKEVIYKGESWKMSVMRVVVVKFALTDFYSDL
jgi:hypothetical protein